MVAVAVVDTVDGNDDIVVVVNVAVAGLVVVMLYLHRDRNLATLYMMTIQVVSNIPLTPKQMLSFSTG